MPPRYRSAWSASSSFSSDYGGDKAYDGLVTGASVRNGLFPAILKRFYERITYILGFGRELRGKYVLAIGAVGMAGGRKPLGKLLTFREFQTNVSDYLFFRTGIPTSRMYGVITFFAQFSTTPRGRHTIRCCCGSATWTGRSGSACA